MSKFCLIQRSHFINLCKKKKNWPSKEKKNHKVINAVLSPIRSRCGLLFDTLKTSINKLNNRHERDPLSFPMMPLWLYVSRRFIPPNYRLNQCYSSVRKFIFGKQENVGGWRLLGWKGMNKRYSGTFWRIRGGAGRSLSLEKMPKPTNVFEIKLVKF